MTQHKLTVNEQRLWNIGLADLSEWRRLVIENDKFWAGLSRLRAQLGISGDVGAQEQGEYIKLNGIERIGIERMAQWCDDLNSLITNCDIPEKWHNEAWGQIWSTRETAIARCESIEEVGKIGGFPGFRITYKDGKGNIEPAILPETDLGNPIVIERLKLIRDSLNQPDLPPQPIITNKHGKLDWRPVWEWHNRHPDVSLLELALRLYRPYQSIRRAMAYLDDCYKNT